MFPASANPAPAFDAEAFVRKVAAIGADHHASEPEAESLDDGIAQYLAAELRPHLATGAADDGEDGGRLTIAEAEDAIEPLEGVYLVDYPDNAVVVSVERELPIYTRGQLRRLVAALKGSEYD
jgi:hypothetical protein